MARSDRQRPARLIVSPPKAGKTMLLQNMLVASLANHPEVT